MRNESRFALPLLAAFALSCSSDGGGPPSVASVAVSPNPATVEVGATRGFTAVARDANGDVVSGRTFTWTSTAMGTATISTSGLATGVTAGVTTIRAETGGVTGSAQLTVTAPGPASVTIEPDSTDVAEGQSVQFDAIVRDGDGMVISASVTWSSANTSVATVDGSGLVTGESQGTTQITASAGGVDSDPAIIVVVPPGNVTVTSITPSPMVEGQSATVRGEGFSASAAQNNVTINGFAAPVTSASDTLLVIDVPEECFPAGDVTVAISTPTGSSGGVAHPMQPAEAPLSMGIGEFLLIQDPADLCLQFAEELLNEEYAFGVQLVAENPNQLMFPRVRGQIPAGAAGSTVSALAAARPSPFPQARALPADDRLQRHRLAEAEFRRRERGWLATMTTEAAALNAGGLRRSSIPTGLAVGDTIPINVPDIQTNSCTNFVTIDAVVRAIGTRGVWLEDIDNPAGGLTSAQIQQLSDLYDDQVHDVNVAWFGEFTDLDGNGKVAVVISKEVNEVPNILGFVTSADLFPEFCASSNNGEVYYSITPDAGASAADILALSPLLLAHELTHVIQFGRRKLATDPFNPQSSWELESQAAFAEEVNGFVDTGRTAGQNYGPDVVFSEDGSFGASWFVDNFTRLALYQGFDGSDPANVSVPGAPEECTWVLAGFSDPGVGPCLRADLLRYMMWVFHRWISDNVAVSEMEARAINRALIDNDISGFANFEEVTGESMAELLGQWAAMLYADDRAPTLDPRIDLPTWDLSAVFAATDPSARLEPRELLFDSFSSDITVRGGSSAYYVISGLNRPATSVRMRAQAGGLLPGAAQIWIVRLQ